MRQKLPAAELGLAVNFAGSGAPVDTVLFWKEWSVYALIVATAIGLVVLAKIYRRAQTAKQRKELGLIVTRPVQYAVLGVCPAGRQFYQLIDRFVNRDILGYSVPTAMFQSVNALP